MLLLTLASSLTFIAWAEKAANLPKAPQTVVVKKNGVNYEVTPPTQDQREIRVKVPEGSPDLPSALTVVLKRGTKVFEKLHLTLNTNREPGPWVYSARVPASIDVSGGITFEIDF